MRMKRLCVAISVVVGTLGIAAPAMASGCEQGDPNCNTGCELINKTPVINKIASCNT
ncbi:MAG: hypothetical protein H0U53_09945 [Actinobacteria bacterium]|nr:hypothetical protein [Actinomycetota bacterium]